MRRMSCELMNELSLMEFYKSLANPAFFKHNI
jgi:hypothetical protein